MKYLVKTNHFTLGKLCKAGTVIDIDPKDEKFYKGNIEKIATEKSAGAEVQRKKVKKDGAD